MLLVGDVDQDYLEQLKKRVKTDLGREVKVIVTKEFPKSIENTLFIELIPQTNPKSI